MMKEEINLKKYIEEAVKLGHFDPEVLNVDINDIRKGIMPEFPKDPPPEMINGYSAKSKLAPKTIEGEPFIKITRKDLARNHKLTDREISDFMNDIKMVNDYIRKNPAELKYAMIRYPKNDPRLAQLNFKMDQMRAASDEYMETHFPENEALFKKIQNKIKDNIEKTDPRRLDTSVPIVSEEEARIARERRLSVLERYKKQVNVKPFFDRKTPEIDWKIDYLNKEMEKTGLQEVMTTSNVYQGTEKIPNTDFSDFEAIVINGYGLGLSGGDGNGAGGAYVGKLIPSEFPGLVPGIHGVLDLDGVAVSPPHPISGQREYASTLTGFAGDMSPLRPGKIQGQSGRVRGGALWFFNPNFPAFGGRPPGRWHNFEWHTTAKAWGFYDTSFFTGSTFLNTNIDQYELNGVNLGTQIKNQIASINFGSNGTVGTPKTIVFTQNRLDDPSFIPIDIGKLSPQGYNYLKGKSAKGNVAYYSPEDKKNVINYYKKKQADPNYQPKPYERESLLRQMRAQGDGIEIASTDPSAAFPSAPSDAFEPETVDVELTPEDIPDEFKADDSEKPSAQGVTLTKWMSRTDFMKNYPDSSMEEYLSALPYGATNFMKPDPNFPGARILDTAAYERYFMNGDTSGVSGKPKHSTATPEPEQKKWGGKTKEQIIADLEADSAKYSAEEKAAKEEMQRIALELGMDFVSLIGGLFTGGTTAAPVLGKLGMKLLKKYGKTVAGKMLRKLLKKFRNKKNNNQIDDIVDAIERGGNDPETPTRKPFGKDQGDSYTNLSKAGEKRYDNAFDKLNNQKGLGGADGDLARRLLDDLEAAAEVSDTAVNNVINKAKKSSIGYLFNSYKSDGKLLSEAAKLGHFEPEVLNVDIEKLRKGILPEFPKDPPPEMINGYSAKSKLAPKTIEGEPFLNITRKDLAKNHRFTDKEINEFMDEINAINDYIRKNPAELKYAMIRYPKDDPRLAQLNWQMDQKLSASEEYMDTHFPENKSLFNKLQIKIKQNIDSTDPKNFKDHTPPPQFTDESDKIKRRKEIVSRHFKKRKKKG